MSIIVFAGPTLSANEIAGYLDATVLPPVQQGDVYRVVKDRPRAVGIIDGYFDGVPSVWHKEILWALEQGIPVYGSASMGALRAAELADFGMIGVGQVFQGYLGGVIEDDDEVAVLHSPAALGFKPLSEPMVSVRATVLRAREEGVLPAETAIELVALAKSLNYRDRLWDRITAPADAMPGMDAFQRWLPQGAVDAKGDDAREMLSLMAQHLQDDPHIPAAPARVERTLAWRDLCDRIDGEHPEGGADDAALVDELRLDPDSFGRLRDRAAHALLSREEAQRAGRQPDKEELVQQMSRHRDRAGLPRHADLMRWLEENDLTLPQYEALLADRSYKDAVLADRNGQLDAALMNELRHDDRYATLRDRAARKRAVVSAPGGNGADAPAGRIRMLIWYFETRLDRPVPDDLESYAIALGLDGRDRFVELIEAEYLFCQLNGSPAEGGLSD